MTFAEATTWLCEWVGELLHGSPPPHLLQSYLGSHDLAPCLPERRDRCDRQAACDFQRALVRLGQPGACLVSSDFCPAAIRRRLPGGVRPFGRYLVAYLVVRCSWRITPSVSPVAALPAPQAASVPPQSAETSSRRAVWEFEWHVVYGVFEVSGPALRIHRGLAVEIRRQGRREGLIMAVAPGMGHRRRAIGPQAGLAGPTSRGLCAR